uniref:Uncharacterized protein n=1 Tax=Octopus bimaculoides TaxID=37653 RepID=A0A0L8GG28_OCTBM
MIMEKKNINDLQGFVQINVYAYSTRQGSEMFHSLFMRYINRTIVERNFGSDM